MNRKEFLYNYVRATQKDEKIKGTLKALYYLFEHCDNEQKLSVLDKILKDYVTSKENASVGDENYTILKGTYIITCKIPEILSDKIIRLADELSQYKHDRDKSERVKSELKQHKIKKYLKELEH